MEAENVMTLDFTTKVGYEFAIRWTLEFAVDFGDAMYVGSRYGLVTSVMSLTIRH